MPLKKKKPKRTARKKTLKRKVLKRQPAKKRAAARKKTVKARRPKAKETLGTAVGIVTHYFPKVRAAVVKLKSPLNIGDTLRIKGHTTDFTQAITSMQIDRSPITQAKKGQEIGLLVESRVRQHDLVYKL
jgi:putative protease